MKYLLLIHNEEQTWGKVSDAERQRVFGEYGEFNQQIRETGHFIAGAQLQPTSTATSVRVRDGKRLVTAGPFAETREQLGGYFLIEARDLDDAISIAARIPSARMGTIEIRPVVEMGSRATASNV